MGMRFFIIGLFRPADQSKEATKYIDEEENGCLRAVGQRRTSLIFHTPFFFFFTFYVVFYFFMLFDTPTRVIIDMDDGAVT